MSNYKKISSEIVHKNPFWTYYHDKYLLPDGKEGDYYYGENEGSGCAIVVPVLDDGRLLLTRQYRYLREKQSVEFPRGGMMSGESPSEAVEREFLEETGYKADEMIKLGAFDGINGVFKDTAHVFIARGLQKAREPAPDATESIEVFFRHLDEFEEMIKNGEIWDGQTLATWALARNMI